MREWLAAGASGWRNVDDRGQRQKPGAVRFAAEERAGAAEAEGSEVTTIATRKTRIKTKTSASYRGRALVVDLDPIGVTIRESGRRRGYWVPWLAVYQLGGKLEAREAVALKRKRKRKAE